ncbi:HAMP domain-containing sensor histidine kinase [Actinoallomurus bryophytorum]|uniref:histidine kinase n=1 Tax=Actinoallomurus bryophytorum TaxID=1490222 RepID=A0A543BZ17_9ACTN|nr:HAMP domain-containing sensor histidine kinase [Actinoallomurus bryophytorum]TQL90068.1 signal transduction histidine kinase [Actinoallomurus bryophytorum]
MLRRMLVLYASLLLLVLAALEIPLAVAVAARDTQTLFIDQLNDTARFASLAEPALRSGEMVTLRAELTRYDSLYGIAAAIVDQDGRIVISSRPGLSLGGAARSRLRAALSGDRSGIEEVVWPWRRAPLVVAEPVGRGGEVVATAVTIAPTGAVRSRITTRWTELAAAGLAALLGFGLAAVPLTRWVLRPVRELDEVTGELSAGQWQARVPVTTGPAEMRRLGEHFNTMAAAMSRILEQQKSFVSYAGHQLRNPLAALRLRVENLAPHLPPAGERDLELAIDEAGRLGRILDGILALVRAEGGNYRICVVDCGRVARERVTAWRHDSSGVRLRCRGATHAAAFAVQGGVGQILDALIDNATKFAGPDATVTVTVSRPHRPADGLGEPVVGIDVVDDGPGLSEADLASATQRFWRGAEHQNVDGTGLGLAIAGALAEASGGVLLLGPARPRGLHARVVLPAAAGSPPEPGPVSSAAWTPGSNGSPRDAAAADSSRSPRAG